MGLSLESFTKMEQGFVWLLLALTALYLWYSHVYGYWASKGVPGRRPLPLFGNIFEAVLSFKCLFQVDQEIYNEFKDEPVVGTYDMTIPKLMLRDPELIEQVMVRDFTSFMDRALGTDPNMKGLNMHLINLGGAKWRSLRNKLTPVFTSGKMKGMMPQLEECSQRLNTHLQAEIKKGTPLDVKYEMSGYTMDVISSCAFGLSFNAIDDSKSPFRVMGDKIFTSTKFMVILSLFGRKFPMLMKMFRRLFGRHKSFDHQEYVSNLVTSTMKYREENNVKRQDFLHLMMELKKQDENKTPGTDEVMVTDRVISSNALVFLLAGYETTASTMSFLLYELAVHQDIQERLYRELNKVLLKNNGELTWDTLKQMEYLEQCTAETLRKYPPATQIRRTSIKTYKFPKTDLELPVGSIVSIPVYALHHDPKYFPNPEKFDPERFSPKNINNIVKYTYLPFGDGPRICIGMRFAKMEIKMAVTRLLKDFKVKLNPKTISPLQFDTGALLLAPVGGIWLDFSLRNKDK